MEPMSATFGMRLLVSALLGLTSAEVGRRSVLLSALASAAPSPAVAAHTQPPTKLLPSRESSQFSCTGYLVGPGEGRAGGGHGLWGHDRRHRPSRPREDANPPCIQVHLDQQGAVPQRVRRLAAARAVTHSPQRRVCRRLAASKERLRRCHPAAGPTVADATVVVTLQVSGRAASDHVLQAAIITELKERRRSGAPMAVGLEAIQRQFQPVLDEYTQGRISTEQLRVATQWDTRWSWPFARYVPVLHAAREAGVRLLALNVDSEDLRLVQEAGFPGLGRRRSVGL